MIRVVWPEETRLIPVVSHKIRLRFYDGAQPLREPEYIVRPNSSVTIPNLPAKDLRLVADALPNEAESTTPVASLSKTVTIEADKTTTIEMTLNTTITEVEVLPANPELEVGKSHTFTANPRDAEGRSVLTSATKTTWTSSDPSIATVDEEGVVRAVATGTTTIQFTDTESGKSGTSTLRVIPVLPPPPAPCADPMSPSQMTVDCITGVATHVDTGRPPGHEPIPLSDIGEISAMGARVMRFDLPNRWVSNIWLDNPEFYFSEADAYINEATSRGIRVVLILGFGYPDDQHMGDKGMAPITDKHRGKWAKYVTAVRDHYRAKLASRDVILSVWNEPLDQRWTDWGSSTVEGVADAYMQVLQATSQILHDPTNGVASAILAAPVTDIGRGTGPSTLGTEPFLRRCKEKGLLAIPNLMIDIHPGGAPLTPEDPAEGNIDFEPEMMSGHHPTQTVYWPGAMDLPDVRAMFPGVPLLISEWAFNCGTKHNQAPEMIRGFLCGIDAGASAICTYQYREWSTSGSVMDRVWEKNHGLVNLAGEKTASWNEYQRFVTALRGYRKKSRIQVVQPGRFRMEFQNAEGNVKTATWAVKGYETADYPRMPKIL
jgi:hypothetical protein